MSAFGILLWLTPYDFTHQSEASWAVKGLATSHICSTMADIKMKNPIVTLIVKVIHTSMLYSGVRQ